MAGVVTAVLTDKELDAIIRWGERGMRVAPNYSAADYEDALLAKARAWRRSLDCTAGKCAQLKGRDDV